MRQILPLIMLHCLPVAVWAQDYTQIISTTNGSRLAIETKDIDSIYFVLSKDVQDSYKVKMSIPWLIEPDNSDFQNKQIEETLQKYGKCLLSKGIYRISAEGITMPPNTTIEGIGVSSVLLLDENGGNNGFVIKPNTNCNIKNIYLKGSETTNTISANVGNRHGLYWEGNAKENGSSNASIPTRALIDNVYISDFSGGGATLNNTGYGIDNCVTMNNCYIWRCNVGINIPYWSEYHRFSNTHIAKCHYGVVNNGGNNMFSNCAFNTNVLAFYIDNSKGDKINNSHGSAVGCTFNHSGGNTGIGVKIVNATNGFVFSGCQFFFSKIVIDNSAGILLANSNFGRDISIELGKGTFSLFSNCVFANKPTIIKEESNKSVFSNCFNANNGDPISLKGEFMFIPEEGN